LNIRIVLTDVHIPGSMNGLKLAHYVRERHPPVLLIVASGVAKPTQAELPPGALFFAKPFVPKLVLSAIERALAA
jgi:DNA-binding NtrC family response regulator